MINLKSIYRSLEKIEKQMKVYELIDDDPEMKMKALDNTIKEFDLIGDAALEGIKDATASMKKIGSEDIGKRIEKLTEIN
ncbi:hypothetical protein RFW13_16690 [Bacillus pumilus]|uniref:hypothetical protein n=1 Tax=Bacillus pumilus TaxID=1408 RepID=UPI0028140563|nr:hypothetical protein [Bacillus pumilus]MDR0123063.1 hypothetical protein [Bacillus pumilus]